MGNLSDYKVKEYEYAGRTITIYSDPDPINPIKEYDTYTHMVCAHRRYNLGHQQRNPETEAELRERVDGVMAVLPLYLYDHSGITISCGPYSCGFDSGQVGWAYVTRNRIAAMGDDGFVENDPRLLDIIRSDVKSYDDYLTGECYGYVIAGKDGDELDSCWGYLGDVKYCEEEANVAAENSTDPADDRIAAELGSRATYAGVAS